MSTLSPGRKGGSNESDEREGRAEAAMHRGTGELQVLECNADSAAAGLRLAALLCSTR